jgi:hypothetical protein
MDLNITLPVGSSSLPLPAPGAGSGSAPSAPLPGSVDVDAPPPVKLPHDGQRLAAVAQAAGSYPVNQYPVGDKSFSIFKDATGQYITRYVSLRDGSVTYLPEPELFKRLPSQSQSAQRLAIVA